MYPALSKTVFTVFMVLVPILLLNMLIAMMGNTYAHVIEQSEKEWMKQVKHNNIGSDYIILLNKLISYNPQYKHNNKFDVYILNSVGQDCSHPRESCTTKSSQELPRRI